MLGFLRSPGNWLKRSFDDELNNPRAGKLELT